MNKRKKALKNVISSAVQQIITIMIGLLIPKIIITGYGSEINGLLSSIKQLMVYLALFEAGVGVASLQALYKPVAIDDTITINGIISATNRYFKKTAIYYFFSLLFVSALYPVFVHTTLSWRTVLLIIFFNGASKGIYFLIHGKYVVLLLADGKGYVYSRITTIVTIMIGRAKIILFSNNCNVLAVMFITFVIQTIIPIYIYIYVKKEYGWLSVNIKYDDSAISQKNYVLIHQISSLVFNNTDVLILTLFCGLKIVSVYSLYKLIITQIESLLSIIYNGFSFSLGQTYQTDKEKFKKYIDIYESFYSIIAFALFSAAMHLLIPFMELYTDGVNDIEYSDFFIALLFICIAVLTAMRSTMLSVINFAGHFKKTVSRAVTEAGINLTVSIIGAVYFGIYGVLLGTIVALLYRTADVICYANKYLLNRPIWKTVSIHGVNMSVTFLLYFIVRYMNTNIDSYISFILFGCVYTFIALIVLLTVQCMLFDNFREFIKEMAIIIIRFFNRKKNIDDA